LQLTLLYVPALSRFFGTVPLSGADLLVCLGVSLVFFVYLELDKLRILWGHRRRSDAV
jgi:Ca2+-transporting ATPase